MPAQLRRIAEVRRRHGARQGRHNGQRKFTSLNYQPFAILADDPWRRIQLDTSRPASQKGAMEMQSIATSASVDQTMTIPASVTAAVRRLLSDADKVLGADHVAAKSCITQATALLRAGRDRGEQPLGASEASSRSGLAPWQIRKVQAYMDDYLDTPIRIGTLARISRLSASYFSVLFKRSFGETLQTHLSRRRVERAQEVMLTTDHVLSQIALDCGFCDQAHLSRMFRRLTGVAPNQWRRQRLAQPACHARTGRPALDVR